MAEQSSATSIESAKLKKTKTSCLICDKIITDPSTKVKGHDSVFCEGECKGWLHRTCAGLSKPLFLSISSNQKPFYCLHCSQFRYEKEITSLKSQINDLTERIKHLETPSPQPQPSFADMVRAQEFDNSESIPTNPSKSNHRNPGITLVQNQQNQRRFNIVVYGVKECASGTNRHNRLINDSSEVAAMITRIDSSIPESSILDVTRLGTYNNDRNRPILAKLARTCEVSSILSQRGSLRGSGLAVKPDLSKQERLVDQILMKKRWELIQSGTRREHISIRGGSLFVKKIKKGSVVSGAYVEYEECNDVDNAFSDGEQSQSSHRDVLSPSSHHGDRHDEPNQSTKTGTSQSA